MKIDIRPVVKNYEGKEMKTRDENDKELPLTIRRALNFIINGVEMVPGPRGSQPKVLTAEEKGKVYQLSTKLWGARKRVNFTPSEVTFLRVRAGKVGNITPLIYGRVCDLLEGKNEESAKPEKNAGEGEAEASPKADPKKG